MLDKSIVGFLFLILIIALIIPIFFSDIFNSNPCYIPIYDVNPNDNEVFDYATFLDELPNDNNIIGQYVNGSLIGQTVNKIDIYVANTTTDLGDSILEVGIYDYDTNGTVISFGQFNSQDLIPNVFNTISFTNDNNYQLQQGDIVGMKMINSNTFAGVDVFTQDAFITENIVSGELAVIQFAGNKFTELDFIDLSATFYTISNQCDIGWNIVLLIPILAIIGLLIILIWRKYND